MAVLSSYDDEALLKKSYLKKTVLKGQRDTIMVTLFSATLASTSADSKNLNQITQKGERGEGPMFRFINLYWSFKDGTEAYKGNINMRVGQSLQVYQLNGS